MTLREEIENAEKALSNMKALHKAVWEEHGSNLCSGELIAKEKELENEINELKKKYDRESKNNRR